MLFDFLNAIILLGSLQGFIFSFLLFFSPLRRIAEYLLATLLFLLSLASLSMYLNETILVGQMGVILSLVPTIVIMPVGPLIYFYTCAILEPSFEWKRKSWLHFLPVILDLTPIVLAWILTAGYLLKSLSQTYLSEWGLIIDQYNTYLDIPYWMSITAYLLITKKYLKKIDSSYGQQERSRRSPDLSWLKQFLNLFLIFQMIWLAYLIPYVIPTYRFVLMENLGYYPVYIPLALLIYALGIKGFIHIRPSAKRPTENRSIRLTKKESEEQISALKRAMEKDKLYLQNDLTLGRLVKHINSDQRTVSHVLNQHLHISFNAFVNHYRVEEVKQRMSAPDNKHLTLSGIAFECGFNSQSTFQRVFKQLTKFSPKVYYSKLHRN